MSGTDTLLWGLAVVMIVVGIVGTVLPALPGVIFVFAGIALGAWIDGYTRIGVGVVVTAGVLTVVSIAVDIGCQLLFAKRAGATKLGILGAAIGTVAGVLAGVIGLVFFPLIGAAIGEFIAHRDVLRAGKVGVSTWLGLLVGTIVKLAIVFAMAGLFVVALLF